MLVTQFVAGLIVGVLLGLALAPVIRSWVVWQLTRESRDGASADVLRNVEERRS